MQVHPAMLWYRELACLRDRGQDDRRRLVDEGVGVHQLCVGEPDIRVLLADGRDLLGRKALAAICLRVLRRDGGEAGEQPPHCRLVLLDGSAARTADAVLEQRVSEDRAGHTVPVLDVVPTARLDAPELRLAARVLIPVELQTTPFRRL